MIRLLLDKSKIAAVCSLCLLSVLIASAQTKRRAVPRLYSAKTRAENSLIKYRTPVPAIVIEENLAVLRFEPGLSAVFLQRMRTGREVMLTGEQNVDGIRFYRVLLAQEKGGWVQADAIASSLRSGDDERAAKIIGAANAFEKIELTSVFLDNFPKSAFRPGILLLSGDLAEEAAARISRDAVRRLDKEEMAANGAPVHSFYLNFNELDRYRRISVNFVLNAAKNQYHYDGAAWREIIQKHPNSNETVEAKKRLDLLASNMK